MMPVSSRSRKSLASMASGQRARSASTSEAVRTPPLATVAKSSSGGSKAMSTPAGTIGQPGELGLPESVRIAPGGASSAIQTVSMPAASIRPIGPHCTVPPCWTICRPSSVAPASGALAIVHGWSAETVSMIHWPAAGSTPADKLAGGDATPAGGTGVPQKTRCVQSAGPRRVLTPATSDSALSPVASAMRTHA